MREYGILTAALIVAASVLAELKAEELPLMTFRSFWHTERVNRQFAEAGVRLVHIYPANTLCSLRIPYTKYPPSWIGPNRYDWKPLKRQIDDIIAWNPKAKLLCMIDLNTPTWWIESHGGADSFRNFGEVSLREDYRRDASAYLRAFLRYTETNHKEKIAAYMLSAGWTCEWYDMGWRKPGPEKLAAFRKWLDDPQAVIPPERMKPSRPPFYDPQADARSIAYWRFSTSVVADRVLECAGQAQEIIRHRVPLGIFYGYILELGYRRLMYEGHLCYERVFSSPDLDFFVSPTSYQERQPGGAEGIMMCVDSLRLRGKQAWLELDHRTWLVNDPSGKALNPGKWKGHSSETETIGVLRRGFAASLIYGMPVWWFDMFGGWYDSPALMAEIARMQRISNRLASRSHSRAEVAVLIDEDSMWYLDGHSPYASAVLRDQRAGLTRMGAPYELYSTLDLDKLDLSRFKLVLLPNLFALTPQKSRLLKEKVFRDGRHVVWGLAPGIITNGRYDLQNIEKLTGIAVDAIRPLSAAMQIESRKMDGWTSVYVSRPNIPAATLRRLAKAAGVHVYSEAGDPLYANDMLLAVHSGEGGRRTFELPKPARVVELFSNRTVANKPVKQFTDVLPPMATHLYHFEP